MSPSLFELIRRARIAEEQTDYPLPAQCPHQLADRAVDQQQNQQPQLQAPEVRPDDLVEHPPVRFLKASRLPPEVDQVLHIAEGKRCKKVDAHLPDYVVDEQLVWELVHHW